MKPRIHVIVDRPEGPRSEAEIEGTKVTSDMLDSAEDLIHTITTGERPVLNNLYDLVARAFGTTRKDAKERILGAAYGMSPQRNDRTVEGIFRDLLREAAVKEETIVKVMATTGATRFDAELAYTEGKRIVATLVDRK